MELIIEAMMVKLRKENTFGGRLAKGREEAERADGTGIGYSQEELAEILARDYGVKIGRSYISELERNWQDDKMPSMEVGRALAQAIGVNFNWLAGLSEIQDPPGLDEDKAWSPTTNAVSILVDKMPEWKRVEVLAIVQAIAPFVTQDAKRDQEAAAPAQPPSSGTSDSLTKLAEQWVDSIESKAATPKTGKRRPTR